MNPLVMRHLRQQLTLAHHAKATRQWALLSRLRTNIRELHRMRWWPSRKVTAYLKYLLTN